MSEPHPSPSGHDTSHHEPMSRPGTVVAGCVLAWIGGALGVIGGVALGALPADSALFVDRFDDPEAAASVIHTVGYVYAAWSVAVIVLAVLAFTGRNWAAIALLVMAAVVMLLALVSAVAGQASGLVSGLWSLLSALLIHRLGDSREWFERMEALRRAS